MRPHRWQPTRLPRPWDSPGKNTGVGCHFLLQCMKVKSESEVAQSCPTLSDPMDCSLPGSSIPGIFPGKCTGVGCHCLLRTTIWGSYYYPYFTGEETKAQRGSRFRVKKEVVESKFEPRTLTLNNLNTVSLYKLIFSLIKYTYFISGRLNYFFQFLKIFFMNPSCRKIALLRKWMKLAFSYSPSK